MSKKRKQCLHCPWRKDVVPGRDIPGGYCKVKHQALVETCVSGIRSMGTMKAMACHESKPGREFECIGWLVNQLGPGNNIGLRILALQGKLPDFEYPDTEQHQRFEDTLGEE